MELYWQFLQKYYPQGLPEDLVSRLNLINGLDEPETALELNNFAVLTLLEAETSSSIEVRTLLLEVALEALQNGMEQQPSHPLCLAHWAMIQAMLRKTEFAGQAFSDWFALLQLAYVPADTLPTGLVYVPPKAGMIGEIARREWLDICLNTASGYQQALNTLSAALCYFQPVFYNKSGLRMLHFVASAVPQVSHLHLKLGLANLLSRQLEGLLNLHQAQAHSPNAITHQALYLAYRKTGQPESAEYWRQEGLKAAEKATNAAWHWATLPSDSPFTYTTFDDQIQMAVEANPMSIVTSVLLAEGDWFEAEMEFWRDRLQPGMTVIDVGANVGVYTFSAARQVGPEGMVIAIEPFSGCVRCLQETCRINQMDWVRVYGAAASDRPGTLRLSLHEASELNELLTDNATASGSVETVSCITLDDLVAESSLNRVDWLKIDAEGHEMQVLAGAERLIQQFRPAILYENIAGANASNAAVGEYLLTKGYQLFRYQPYLKGLMPVESMQDIKYSLNVIALPT